MKLFGLALVLGALGIFAAEPQPFKTDSLLISVGSFTSPSAIWYRETSRKPQVVIWFHGGMQSARCAKGYEAGKALVPFFEKSHKDVWVVSTSACLENHWLESLAQKAVDVMLDSVESRFGKKIDTVSLAGVSDGGLGVVGYSLYGKRTVKSRLLVSTNLSAVSDAKNLSSAAKIRQGTWTFLQGGSDRLYPAASTVPWMETFCGALGRSQCQIRYDERGEHDWSWWTSHRASWIEHFSP